MDPYVYPGTNTLINKFGIKDATKLSVAEGEIFALKRLEPLPEGQLDYTHLKAIHHHFFSELYEWAGKERTVDIAKQNSYFGNFNYVERELNKLFKNLKEENHLQNLTQSEFCRKLSYYFNEINAAHPFREGNGRTQRAFCDLIAEKAGYYLDWKLFQGREQEYLQASVQGFMHGNYAPMEKIFNQIVSPLNRIQSLEISVENLNHEAQSNLKDYVDKQVKLTELVKQKNQFLTKEPHTAKRFGQEALSLNEEIKVVAKKLAAYPEVKHLLENQKNFLFKMQGGFSGIKNRLYQNKITSHDILFVIHHARNQFQNTGLSQHRSQGKNGGRSC